MLYLQEQNLKTSIVITSSIIMGEKTLDERWGGWVCEYDINCHTSGSFTEVLNNKPSPYTDKIQ